ncbi:SETMR methyltransferase, partial [Acromyrmex insinuator]
MSEISEEIRYVMLFYYKKGKNAAQTCRQICEVYGVDAVSECRMQEWFVRFRSGNFDVKDRPRSGRPVTEKVDEILQLIKQDRRVSYQEVANALQEIANALRINHMPHTSLMTRQKLRELGWEVLMHPPYSPDLAPSDY